MPPVPYNGSYDMLATEPTPQCPQLEGQVGSGYPQSEDCLRLNIFVPPNAQNLPVKAFIFGGGNIGGANTVSLYYGCNAATDAIIVNINYRTGPWGFLALTDYGVNGNQGLKDQILALTWIKNNIATFGGDPSKVLVYGQSAGAEDTFILGTLPQITGLVKAGIAESSPGQKLLDIANATATGLQYAKRLKCDNLTCLQELPLATTNVTALGTLAGIRLTLQQFLVPGGGGIFFEPVIDGDFITAQPQSVGPQVPFIIGHTTEEATFLVSMIFENPSSVTETIYSDFVKAAFNNSAAILAAYPVSRFNNTAYPAYYAFQQVLTDSQFSCVAYRGLAKAVERGTPVWTYSWGHQPTCYFSGEFPPDFLVLEGAVHTSDLPFVFGNVDHSPPPNGNCSMTDAEKALSRQIIKYWTNMASDANPGADWPQFSTDTSLGLNIMNQSALAVPGVVDYSECISLFT